MKGLGVWLLETVRTLCGRAPHAPAPPRRSSPRVAPQGHERRACRRLPATGPAVIRNSEGYGGRASSECGSATIVDISEGGALVRTRQGFDKGARVRLSADSALDLEARVVRVHALADGTLAVSLQFVSPTPAEASALRGHLERLAA